jgi:hypothetical protein
MTGAALRSAGGGAGADDADGHKKLGEMYQSARYARRPLPKFRSAISKNERLFSVY